MEAKPGSPAVAGLSQFFPNAVPARLAVRVMRDGMAEETVVEFRTTKELLFVSTLPLEFEDRLTIAAGDGSLRAVAAVVALRVTGQSTAVAARILHESEQQL